MRNLGAVSSARLMQQAIDLLKIVMLHGQVPNKFLFDRMEGSCVLALEEFVVLFYVPHYLQEVGRLRRPNLRWGKCSAALQPLRSTLSSILEILVQDNI